MILYVSYPGSSFDSLWYINENVLSVWSSLPVVRTISQTACHSYIVINDYQNNYNDNNNNNNDNNKPSLSRNEEKSLKFWHCFSFNLKKGEAYH